MSNDKVMGNAFLTNDSHKIFSYLKSEDSFFNAHLSPCIWDAECVTTSFCIIH